MKNQRMFNVIYELDVITMNGFLRERRFFANKKLAEQRKKYWVNLRKTYRSCIYVEVRKLNKDEKNFVRWEDVER